MIQATCKSCRFFVRDKRPEYHDRGHCYRYPPMMVWMAGVLPDGGDWGQERPYMYDHEFCGEQEFRDGIPSPENM